MAWSPKNLHLKAWWRPEDYKPGQPWIDCIGGQKLTGNYESSKNYNPLLPRPETVIVTGLLSDEQRDALETWLREQARTANESATPRQNEMQNAPGRKG
jgi:hypothetical protein